jgi:3-phosphoshikimate 1-carboxyvinyltransferase
MTVTPDVLVARPGGRPAGAHRVPGDKSISHRALMLGALAEGETRISGLLEGADCLATAGAMKALGAIVERTASGEWRIAGRGAAALAAPAQPIDCGNSGTAARLLMGVLAARPGTATLTGDESLSRRPMRRVAEPLARMGARIELGGNGTLPARVTGNARLAALDVRLEVASAQVKSALLLAGAAAGAPVRISSPATTRDHTERMLRTFGAEVHAEGDAVRLARGARLVATTIEVPGDLSSAAFLLGAAALVPGARLTVTRVGLNPTRTGFLALLERLGARVEVAIRDTPGGEPVGDVTVEGRELRGIDIPAELVPLAIDELPLVMVLAAAAAGRTRLRGAGELRVKESDRIAGVAAGLVALGIQVESHADGLDVLGGRLAQGTVDSRGDHRLAMAFAVAAVRADGPIRVLGSRFIDTSFPGFLASASAAGLLVGGAAA